MTTYFVSPTGKDTNAGTSAAQSLATIQAAADRTKPGDVVEVMSGIYSRPTSGGYVVDITKSGTASAPIVFEAAPGQHPVIDSSNQWAGIEVDGSSFITVQGFEVTGDAANISASYAQSQANNTNNPTTAGNGIEIAPPYGGGANPTHVTIQNNVVHDQPGAGIDTLGADYVSILNNTVYDDAWWSPYGNSGISVFKSASSDSNTGYKTVIAGNTVYGNREYVAWKAAGKITDGNGIIVDSNNQSGYNGRTLVENNVTYNNGGTGAHAFDSDHVDFFYNTAYQNNQSPGLQEGQIVGQRSSDVRIENNILEAAPGGQVNDAGATYDYNVFYGGNVLASGPHDIVADPLFASPGSGDFALQAGSPAIGSATAAFAAAGQQVGASASDLANRGAFRGVTSGASSGQSGGSGDSGPVNSAADTLVLNVSADVWKGAPQFLVSIDGAEQTGTFSTSARHGAHQSQAFTFTGNFGSGGHDVAVTFLNDAWGGTPSTDRNLYVDSIDYDGVAYPSASGALYSDGTMHFTIPAAANG
ncbi:MAG: right-handed parallel beta-helix repeat-containing protein [Acetobacteraceae bacterium]|nr:right-handed parallel beta-helix repeat-containing protein [Acetobacteraceae bacterium]